MEQKVSQTNQRAQAPRWKARISSPTIQQKETVQWRLQAWNIPCGYLLNKKVLKNKETLSHQATIRCNIPISCINSLE